MENYEIIGKRKYESCGFTYTDIKLKDGTPLWMKKCRRQYY